MLSNLHTYHKMSNYIDFSSSFSLGIIIPVQRRDGGDYPSLEVHKPDPRSAIVKNWGDSKIFEKCVRYGLLKDELILISWWLLVNTWMDDYLLKNKCVTFPQQE